MKKLDRTIQIRKFCNLYNFMGGGGGGGKFEKLYIIVYLMAKSWKQKLFQNYVRTYKHTYTYAHSYYILFFYYPHAFLSRVKNPTGKY